MFRVDRLRSCSCISGHRDFNSPYATGIDPIRVWFVFCLAPSDVHSVSQCGTAAVAASLHIGQSIKVVNVSTFKLDLHVLSLLDVCSPLDLQYLKCSEDY